MTGGRYERELVEALDAIGLAAMRAPASGSKTDRALPDVLAGHGVSFHDGETPGAWYSECMAIELKTTEQTTAYVGAEEVEALEHFAEAFGARPYLVGRFKRPGPIRPKYYFVRPGDCRMTDSGNYGIPEADADDRAEFLLMPSTDSDPAEKVMLA